MNRRSFLVAAGAGAIFLVTPPAFAGSYLNRAALLLDQTRREGDMVQPRTHDKELVSLVQKLAEARVESAARMEVPAKVGKAHPHLLLVLENAERAATAALSGDFKKFSVHLFAAREEDRIFRSVLTTLGYTLPDLDRDR
jgi:hypothetical protein